MGRLGTFIPRDYQERSVDDLWSWFLRHPTGNPVMSLSVAAGKSLIIAMVIQRALREYPDTRVIVIAHQKELITQNLEKLTSIWPEANVGIYSAALGKKELGRPITYATIGSIYKKAHLMGHVQLILADEAHLISTKEEGMWRSFISDMQRYGNPGIRVIGLTGTPFRSGGVWITAGDSPLFSGIASTVSMRELLERGFLSPLTNASTSTRIDTSGVRTIGGDYVAKDLAAVSDRDDVVSSACLEITRLAYDRRRWLIFAVDVKHAQHINAELLRLGVSSAVVTGETPKAERESLLADYASDKIRCLVSIGVLTTGFDQPDIDFIGLLRATKSPTLYVQMIGRGLRLADGKTNCAVADFTDTVERLGPVDLIQGHAPRRRTSDTMPLKICDACGSPNAISARECIDCGAPFQIEETDPHRGEASGAAIISTEAASRKYEVTSVTYAKHTKPGKPPSLRVEYWSGIRVVAKEWIGIESDSAFARSKASYWWWQRCGQSSPDNVEEALADAKRLRQPEVVIVNETKKYPEVVGYEWRAP